MAGHGGGAAAARVRTAGADRPGGHVGGHQLQGTLDRADARGEGLLRPHQQRRARVVPAGTPDPGGRPCPGRSAAPLLRRDRSSRTAVSRHRIQPAVSAAGIDSRTAHLRLHRRVPGLSPAAPGAVVCRPGAGRPADARRESGPRRHLEQQRTGLQGGPHPADRRRPGRAVDPGVSFGAFGLGTGGHRRVFSRQSAGPRGPAQSGDRSAAVRGRGVSCVDGPTRRLRAREPRGPPAERRFEGTQDPARPRQDRHAGFARPRSASVRGEVRSPVVRQCRGSGQRSGSLVCGKTAAPSFRIRTHDPGVYRDGLCGISVAVGGIGVGTVWATRSGTAGRGPHVPLRGPAQPRASRRGGVVAARGGSQPSRREPPVVLGG